MPYVPYVPADLAEPREIVDAVRARGHAAWRFDIVAPNRIRI